MATKSTQGNRSFGLEGAGKGDADRSPGWRAGYDDINWGNEHATPAPLTTFKRFFRRYGKEKTEVRNPELNASFEDIFR